MARVRRPCGCLEPTTHRDCLYCGVGGNGQQACGVCRESGVDGQTIRGTERRRCAKHRKEA